MYFKDRTSAGIALGGILVHHKYISPIIFALPRGGLPVAVKVADILSAPLEIIVVRKLGMPFDPEFAFGAIAPNGIEVINEQLVSRFGITEVQIDEVREAETKELDRRVRKYSAWTPTNLTEHTAIIVDDGIATGRSALAAVKYLQQFSPAEIIVATPAISTEAANLLEKSGANVIYLIKDDFFVAVGEYYDEFPQLTDENVISIGKRI